MPSGRSRPSADRLRSVSKGSTFSPSSEEPKHRSPNQTLTVANKCNFKGLFRPKPSFYVILSYSSNKEMAKRKSFAYPISMTSHHGIILEVVSTWACFEKVGSFLITTRHQQAHAIRPLGGIPWKQHLKTFKKHSLEFPENKNI